MKRYMAHKVIVDNVMHKLSIVTINDDGSVYVSPFDAEIHSTRFIDGTLIVDTISGVEVKIYANGQPLST